jgi:hypothetical protein
MKLKYFSIVALMSGLVLSSCVKDDIYNGPATISNVAFSQVLLRRMILLLSLLL